jgi:mRNA interferase RelE/StbE
VYSIRITKSAGKHLDDLDDDLARRMDTAIIKLAANPRSRGCKKLKGQRDTWRIRIGTYRVLYAIDEKQKQITILGILHRREAYK